VGLLGLSLNDADDVGLAILALEVDDAVSLGVVRVHLCSQAVDGARVESAVASVNVPLEIEHGNHAVPSADRSKHGVKSVESGTTVSSNVEIVVATVVAES
jgi:hypothetical protein